MINDLFYFNYSTFKIFVNYVKKAQSSLNRKLRTCFDIKDVSSKLNQTNKNSALKNSILFIHETSYCLSPQAIIL